MIECSECYKRIDPRAAVAHGSGFMCRACHEELLEAYSEECAEEHGNYIPDLETLRKRIEALHEHRRVHPKTSKPARINTKRTITIPGSNRKGNYRFE